MLGHVHINTGDGKGKTTSAIGTAVRAAGENLSVKFVQFFKNETGEKNILPLFCDFVQFEHTYPLAPNPIAKKYTADALRPIFDEFWLREVEMSLKDDKYDVFILDEVGSLFSAGMITEERLIKTISKKNESTELVMTGRGIPQSLIEHTSYWNRVESEKHPYQKGIPARKGIEF